MVSVCEKCITVIQYLSKLVMFYILITFDCYILKLATIYPFQKIDEYTVNLNC